MKKLFLLFLVFVVACGFKAVYGDNDINFSKLGIVINHNSSLNSKNIEAKYSNLLHKELNLDKPSVEADGTEYVLEIDLTWNVVGSLRRSSGSSSRKNVIFYAKYKLKDSDGKVFHSDEVKTIGSFDVSTTSRFTNSTIEGFVMDNLVYYSVWDLKNKIINIY